MDSAMVERLDSHRQLFDDYCQLLDEHPECMDFGLLLELAWHLRNDLVDVVNWDGDGV